MILYQVTIQVEPSLAGAVQDHMTGEHIPEIFATGCFQRIHFERASPARFRTTYEAKTQADIERYLQEHAPRFRAEFQTHFPTGVTITRETWTRLESWG